VVPYGNFIDFYSIYNLWSFCTIFSPFSAQSIDRTSKVTLIVKIWHCGKTVFVKTHEDRYSHLQKRVNFTHRITILVLGQFVAGQFVARAIRCMDNSSQDNSLPDNSLQWYNPIITYHYFFINELTY